MTHPSPRQGCTLVPGRGYPSPGQGVPPVRLGRGTPPPTWTGWGTHHHPGQDGVPPSQVRMEYPSPSQDRMGYLQPGQDGVPLPPPRPGQDGVPPGTCYAWTGYAAGGTLFAVSCRRTVLFPIVLVVVPVPVPFPCNVKKPQN